MMEAIDYERKDTQQNCRGWRRESNEKKMRILQNGPMTAVTLQARYAHDENLMGTVYDLMEDRPNQQKKNSRI
jgi:hypothetical protein